MNPLPIESTRWRENLKHQIGMETAILRTLIQWGMGESASDICRSLDEHFEDVLESQQESTVRKSLGHTAPDRAFVRDLLRDTYLRTREIPRRGVIQERLHDGLLTGFEALSMEILQSYEGFLFMSEGSAQGEKAA